MVNRWSHSSAAATGNYLKTDAWPLLGMMLMCFLEIKQISNKLQNNKRAETQTVKLMKRRQVCDIIVPTAPRPNRATVQRASGSHLDLSSPRSPSSPSPSSSFFFLFFRESGRRKQEVAGLCLIPFLNSAPQLLWLDTGAGVCLRLYRFPPLLTQDHPFFSAHLLSLSAFPLERPARGIYREDNVQRSSLHSFSISDFYFYFYFLPH